VSDRWELDGAEGSDALPPALRSAVDLLRAVPTAAPGAAERAAAAAVAAQREAVAPRRAAGSRVAAWAAAVAIAAVGLGAGVWADARRDAAPAEVAGAERAAPRRVGEAPDGPVDAAFGEPFGARGVAAAAPAAGSAAALDEAPRAVRFTLRAPEARRVAVVGDFNRWDPAATPLAGGAGGTWTTEVLIPPGRHAYAFVVDGRRWVLDPAAPSERDPDFGRAHSVTVVGAVGVEGAP
jgi:hypothetical protein